ncbi:hypothetical protein GCM10010172_12920 [Paractinoplanes ferrugineus]|uniref:Uncharacterized protein n=1 Tax=Paractinoplanes ferrugineus TaxID=113564 RepID=A0A919MJ73_9ACTN|nr:hypothetical protein [Actinoplanes ferrugineus]GIE09857.1 hypothetical protein Afe05nite_16970 [Actinoplanes ferrugineus]
MTVTNDPVVQDDLGEIVDLVLRGAEANVRPDLVRRMRLAAADLAAARPAAAVADTVVGALRSLEVDLRSRQATLADPGRGARLAAEARHAESRLRQFQDRAGRWPRVLGDALAATDSDIEFAVHNWLRALLDEGTGAIEEQGLTGDELDRWVRKRLVAEVEAVHRAVRLAAGEIGERVASSIGLSEPVPPVVLDLEPPADLVDYIHRGPRALSERQALATRLVGVVMPTYSGIMVALVLPRLFGIGMSLWLTVVAAVTGAAGLGGAALAGERQRQRSRRDAESAGELRSLIDAFRLAVSKRVRDEVRAIEQQMHAGLSEAVTNESRRLSAMADAARRAAAESERLPEALAEIELDLASIGELRQRAQRFSWA